MNAEQCERAWRMGSRRQNWEDKVNGWKPARSDQACVRTQMLEVLVRRNLEELSGPLVTFDIFKKYLCVNKFL